MAPQKFSTDFRRFFVRGLGALVPTLLTIAILVWAFRLVNDNVGVYITQGLQHFCGWVSRTPAPGFVDLEHDPLRYGTPIDEWAPSGERLTIEYQVIHHTAVDHPDPVRRGNALKQRNEALWQIAFKKYRLNLLGFVIAIILVYFIGFFLASFIGRASWHAVETLLYRIPLIRAIYPSVKQVTDFLLTERQVDFSGVLLVQYPRMGMWSVGMSTGAPMTRLQGSHSDEMITVFVPSSPTPFTGWVIQVPKRDTIELNISLDEALRYLISGGVLKPEELSIGSAAKSLPKVDEA